MEKYEWLVFTCRACRRVIKLAPAMAGKHVICPHCRTKITVPKDAPVIEEAPAQSHIPSARTDEGPVSQLRGPGKEDWERSRRPTGGDLEFRERLHATSAPEMQPDPDKAMRRVNMRRRKHDSIHKDFDDPEDSLRRKRHRKSKNKGAAFNQTFVRGLVTAVILFAIAAAWLGWKAYENNKAARSAKAGEGAKAAQEAKAALNPAGGAILETRTYSDYGPALVTAVRKFVSAPTIEEMLPLVRDRERVEPKIRAYYTAERPWKAIEVNNKFEPSEMFAVDGDFIVLQLVLANYAEMPVSFERKGETFFADWESFTGYGEMSWDELQEKRPGQPVLMRVVIEKSINTDYWNEAFTDHTTHNCYLLRDLKNDHRISGYTRKDSAPDVQLRRWLKPLPQPASLYRALAVVSLRYPVNSKGAHQVEIVEFLENGWVFRPDN